MIFILSLVLQDSNDLNDKQTILIINLTYYLDVIDETFIEDFSSLLC